MQPKKWKCIQRKNSCNDELNVMLLDGDIHLQKSDFCFTKLVKYVSKNRIYVDICSPVNILKHMFIKIQKQTLVFNVFLKKYKRILQSHLWAFLQSRGKCLLPRKEAQCPTHCMSGFLFVIQLWLVTYKKQPNTYKQLAIFMKWFMMFLTPPPQKKK